jgi:hypothetical protein
LLRYKKKSDKINISLKIGRHMSRLIKLPHNQKEKKIIQKKEDEINGKKELKLYLKT